MFRLVLVGFVWCDVDVDVDVQLRKFSATKKRRNSGSRLDMSVGDLDDLAYNDALFGGDDEDMDIDNPSFDHAVAEGSLVVRGYDMFCALLWLWEIVVLSSY